MSVPRGAAPADAGPVQQQPHRARRDREPQPHKFIVDAPGGPTSGSQTPSAGSGAVAPAGSTAARVDDAAWSSGV